jgi:Undecaprenyl-phosphate galactose phosphotransferase WbaP
MRTQFRRMQKKLLTAALLVGGDAAALVGCFILGFVIRNSALPLFFAGGRIRQAFLSIYLGKSFMIIVWVVVFLYEGLYTKRYFFWDEVRHLIKSTTIAFSLIMIALFLSHQVILFSRLIIILAWLLSMVFLPLVRLLVRRILFLLGLNTKKVIILGSHETSATLIETIQQNWSLGYKVVGCLTDDRGRIGMSISGVKILGHIDEIEDWKLVTGFDDTIVTLPDIPRDKMISLLKRWDQASDNIHYIPRTGDLITAGVEVENIGKILSLTVRKNLHKPWNVFVKSVFDYVFGAACLLVCLPFFLIIGLAIRLDSRGPVFFRQERFGKRGREIRVFKFRSMYPDADERLERFLAENREAREEWERFKKLRNGDPRVTRVGRFLRKHSLDELPQLINVLRGDMSLVGPRPYIMEELKEAVDVKSFLLQVKPGITGMWQTSGRNLLPFRERLAIDEHYIRNWSFWLDIVVLIKTFKVWLLTEGAF